VLIAACKRCLLHFPAGRWGEVVREEEGCNRDLKAGGGRPGSGRGADGVKACAREPWLLGSRNHAGPFFLFLSNYTSAPWNVWKKNYNLKGKLLMHYLHMSESVQLTTIKFPGWIEREALLLLLGPCGLLPLAVSSLEFSWQVCHHLLTPPLISGVLLQTLFSSPSICFCSAMEIRMGIPPVWPFSWT
jgi:hypothetical protein